MLLVLELVYLRNTTPFRFNTITHVNPMAWHLLSVVALVCVVAYLDKAPRLRWASYAACALFLFPVFFLFEVKGRVWDFKTADTEGVLLEASLPDYTPELPAAR